MIGSHKYPFCALNTTAFNCNNNYAFNYLLNASSSKLCQRPCKINEYIGKVNYFDANWKKYSIAFAYAFKPPEAKSVEEEYLLYELIGVIGGVGGALSLSIGFSLNG